MAAAQERFSPAGLLLFAARGQKGLQMTKFKMNRTQFMLLTALNMLGSGILMLPAKVAQVGGIGLLSWFVVCLAAVAMAYAFANCGIYSKYRLGGLGAIAENAFGMPGSFCIWTMGIKIPRKRDAFYSAPAAAGAGGLRHSSE